jgi:uncharacterized membrane protein YeaQ/YmgE (transglycosylase-associated protein family)
VYQLPEEPQSIGGVLDDGFQLLKASFGKVLPISLVGAMFNTLPNLMAPDLDPADLSTLPPLLPWVVLLSIVVSLMIYSAVLARIDAVAHNTELRLGAALSVGLRRFFPLLGCFVLYSVAVLAGSLALLIPGIILGLSLVMGPYLVVTARMAPLEALKMSHRLVWGNWWRTALLFSVLTIFVIVAYLLFILLFGLVAAVMFDDAKDLGTVTSLVAGLVTAVISPLMYAFVLSVLHDLQLRKQGTDLDDRLHAIESD